MEKEKEEEKSHRRSGDKRHSGTTHHSQQPNEPSPERKRQKKRHGGFGRSHRKTCSAGQRRFTLGLILVVLVLLFCGVSSFLFIACTDDQPGRETNVADFTRSYVVNVDYYEPQ